MKHDCDALSRRVILRDSGMNSFLRAKRQEFHPNYVAGVVRSTEALADD